MQPTTTEQEGQQSFAESALRLGGKSEEEARRMGAVDKADEQVETLFAKQYQTTSSPIHKAIWEGKVPLELFCPPPLPTSAPCDAAMDRSYDVVKRRREQGQLFDSNRKVSEETIAELAAGRLLGHAHRSALRRPGRPFARFSRFLTRLATVDSTVAALASVHGCIGAVDPVRTFGYAGQKSRLLPLLASGNASPASP